MFADHQGYFRFALEDGCRDIWQNHAVTRTNDRVRRLHEGVDRRRLGARTVLHIVDRHAHDVARPRQRRPHPDLVERLALAARGGLLEAPTVVGEALDQPAHHVLRLQVGDVPDDVRNVDDRVVVQDTEAKVIEEQ